MRANLQFFLSSVMFFIVLSSETVNYSVPTENYTQWPFQKHFAIFTAIVSVMFMCYRLQQVHIKKRLTSANFVNIMTVNNCQQAATI